MTNNDQYPPSDYFAIRDIAPWFEEIADDTYSMPLVVTVAPRGVKPPLTPLIAPLLILAHCIVLAYLLRSLKREKQD